MTGLAFVLLLFEVMDKEPTLLRVGVVSLGLGGLSFFFMRKRSWWGALPVALLLLLSITAHFQELWDPQVGPAILKEAGRQYFVWSYVLWALGVMLPVIGILTRSRPRTDG